MGRTMKVRPKLAVLDVAGTTLDVGDVIPAALRAAFEPLGETLEDSDIAGVRGRSKREAVERLVAKLNPPPEHPTSVSARTWDRFREELRQRLPGSVHPIPGAAEAIAWLRVEVGPVWLTSGFDRETLDDLMRVAGWDPPLIAGTISGDDVERGRPAPDMIHAAMRRSGVTDPRDVLVAGDTEADLEAAAAAGVAWTFGVLTGAHDRAALRSHTEAEIIGSIADLPAWMAGRV